MSDTYFTYSNQNLGLKYRLRCFILKKMFNVGSTQWKLHWAEGFFAHHNKKSCGQKCYHVNSPDENNNIGLVYCTCADNDSSIYGC